LPPSIPGSGLQHAPWRGVIYRDTLYMAKDKFSKQIPSCAPVTPSVAPTFNQINILPHAFFLQELF